LILGGNPVYNAPADLEFAEHLDRVETRIHLGLYEDETSRLCHWHVPETHYLEAWGDTRAYDGTVTIQQPLIAPLYEGAHAAHEVLAALDEDPDRSGYDILRGYWRYNRPSGERRGSSPPSSGDFEQFWRAALHDGLVEGSALGSEKVLLDKDWAAALEKGLG